MSEQAPQRLSARTAIVGTDTPIARVLPQAERRTIGAWCFLDHAGPVSFAPGGGLRVGAHPHTALQTFTWMLEGEVMHNDSLGHRQVVRPGQVNLMTAGHGIAHTEESFPDQTRLHAAQLWIALQMATIYVPWLNPIVKTQPLAAWELGLCVALAALVFVAVELEKAWRRQRMRAGAWPA